MEPPHAWASRALAASPPLGPAQVLTRADFGWPSAKKLSRSENSWTLDTIVVIRIADFVGGTGIGMSRSRVRARAVVAWRRRRAPSTYRGMGVSEAGVERGVIGDALVDEVGGGPGGLAGSEPDGIDGLLGSE